MSFAPDILNAAHQRSIQHEAEIKRSIECGCFFCLSVFRPGEISEWIEDVPQTALCPKCGIDSVIGDASGYPIHDAAFLKAMQELWFSSIS